MYINKLASIFQCKFFDNFISNLYSFIIHT